MKTTYANRNVSKDESHVTLTYSSSWFQELKMTEFKKNNKRSIDTSDKKPATKKFKSSTHSNKPSKDGNSFNGANSNYKGKKFDKNKMFGGKPAKPQEPTEKVNWNELKAKKKDLKIQRKKNKTKELYDIDVKAKKIYEELKM